MSERLTTEQVEAIETRLSHWSGCSHGVVWEPDIILAIIDEWRAQRAVVEAARASDAYWSKRFGCTYQEMAAEIANARHPDFFNPENHLWVALATALAALAEVDRDE